MLKIILWPILISVLAQLIKIALDFNNNRRNFSHIFGYGGMPSSHAALVSSLAVVVYLEEGISVSLAISLIFALLVIRDAIGIRGYLTLHSQAINQIIKDLPKDQEYKYPVLEERIAHTWLQLATGCLIGVVLTWIFYPLL